MPIEALRIRVVGRVVGSSERLCISLFPPVFVVFGPRYWVGEDFMSGLDGLELWDKLFLLPSISVRMV